MKMRHEATNTFTPVIQCVFTFMQSELKRLTGASIEVPLGNLTDWLLKEAPRVDKELCVYLKDHTIRSNGVWATSLGPECLIRILAQCAPLRDARPIEYAHIVRLIRSALLCAYKVSRTPTTTQINDSIARFLETDECCLDSDRRLSDRKGLYKVGQLELEEGSTEHHCQYRRLLASSSRLVSHVVSLAANERHTPRHGPGAVFPPRPHYVRGAFERGRVCQIEDPADVFPSHIGLETDVVFSPAHRCKLTFVPKDARGPRSICIHSAEAMWAQQSYRSALEAAVRKSPVFSKLIYFNDQTRNQEQCRVGSMHGQFATLDLSDASDRLCCQLVLQLFGLSYYREIDSCRAKFVYIPQTDSEHPLHKFATMGNALAFPIQTIVYASLAVSVCRELGLDWGAVRVFGDDIIIPVDAVPLYVALLTWCGLVVNTSKSYSDGFFRESCGLDAWAGLNVTPVRLRSDRLHTLQDAIEFCAFVNNLTKAGFGSVSSRLMSWLRTTTRFNPVRVNNALCSGLAEYVRRPLCRGCCPCSAHIGHCPSAVDAQPLSAPLIRKDWGTVGWQVVNLMEVPRKAPFDYAHNVDESLWGLESTNLIGDEPTMRSSLRSYVDIPAAFRHTVPYRVVETWCPMV